MSLPDSNPTAVKNSKKTFYLESISPVSSTLFKQLFKDYITTKSYKPETFQALNIIQAIAVVKESKDTSYPIIGIKMGDNSYHCVSYTTYQDKFRFINASATRQRKPSLGILGSTASPILFITEGFWDLNTLYEMQYQTCALPGVNNLEDEWLSSFQDKDVYVCFDNDKPGKKYAATQAQRISTFAKSVHIITLPETVIFKNKEYSIKDISDLYNIDHGFCDELFTSLIAEAEDIVLTNKDRIDEIMNGRLTVTQKYNAIAGFIQQDLERNNGKLIPYNNRQELAMVLDGREVHIDKTLLLHLKENYGYLSSVTLWNQSHDQLHQLALQNSSAIVSMYSHSVNGHCYIGTRDQGLIRVSSDDITHHLQGEQDIYIRTDNNVDLSCINLSPSNHPTTLESLLNLFIYDGNDAVQKFLLKVWMYHSFFDPQMRVILCATGEPGSGKTLLLKILKGILFGFTEGRYNPNSIPEEDYVFTEMVKANRYIFLDEVNESDAAMKTKLRMLATGGVSSFRPKYARESIHFHPKVWLAVSSHSPKFRENDIAQRLCIIRLAHPGKKTRLINESLFLSGLEGKRTEIWSNLLSTLQSIIANLHKNKNDHIPLKNYCRQVEMAEFAWQVFPDERELCLKTFESINAIQEGFSAEFDPGIDLIEDWMSQFSRNHIEDGKVKIYAKEMYEEMLGLYKDKGIRHFPASINGFGKWIHSRASILADKYGYERQRDVARDKWIYYFNKPVVESGMKEVF